MYEINKNFIIDVNKEGISHDNALTHFTNKYYLKLKIQADGYACYGKSNYIKMPIEIIYYDKEEQIKAI